VRHNRGSFFNLIAKKFKGVLFREWKGIGWSSDVGTSKMRLETAIWNENAKSLLVSRFLSHRFYSMVLHTA
jgi:hypothetical protein